MSIIPHNVNFKQLLTSNTQPRHYIDKVRYVIILFKNILALSSEILDYLFTFIVVDDIHTLLKFDTISKTYIDYIVIDKESYINVLLFETRKLLMISDTNRYIKGGVDFIKLPRHVQNELIERYDGRQFVVKKLAVETKQVVETKPAVEMVHRKYVTYDDDTNYRYDETIPNKKHKDKYRNKPKNTKKTMTIKRRLDRQTKEENNDLSRDYGYYPECCVKTTVESIKKNDKYFTNKYLSMNQEIIEKKFEKYKYAIDMCYYSNCYICFKLNLFNQIPYYYTHYYYCNYGPNYYKKKEQ
jgi:hypothetical protein